MKAKMTFHYTSAAGAIALAKAGEAIPAEDRAVFREGDPRVERVAEAVPAAAAADELQAEDPAPVPPPPPVDQLKAKKPASKPRPKK